MLIIVINVIGV